MTRTGDREIRSVSGRLPDNGRVGMYAIVKVVGSKACLTRLIWPWRTMQTDTVEAM